ncbi:LUD domain-containing protein [Myroides sp. JBRI-B21084]|uniref:LUD domain-containing protein n=1 Tax=Myroides sp. JBRI-B21084 TaxID=3119977 RepID=UPI0026E29C2A|nr:LUD domain-containing protein [Paenimyroides cloacae]WKW47362.1 LUD domain-containing protein [Paenimyroides cloacae]
MNIFKKIFSSFSSSHQNKNDEESKYLPEKEIPVDEQFTHNFKKNGGKFLYCENEEELEENFISILQENDWFEMEALTFEKELYPFLIENKLNYKNPTNPVFLLTSCEGLIAQDGSVLLSSKQIFHHKPNDLPKNIIVVAKTSQITRTKSDGLSAIKNRYKNEIPTNITTMQCFKENKNDDFLQYGIQPKNVYLLLLENY